MSEFAAERQAHRLKIDTDRRRLTKMVIISETPDLLGSLPLSPPTLGWVGFGFFADY